MDVSQLTTTNNNDTLTQPEALRACVLISEHAWRADAQFDRLHICHSQLGVFLLRHAAVASRLPTGLTEPFQDRN